MARKRSSIQRFEELRVWQAARELVRGVYRATRSQTLKGDAGLIDQMTRAAVSIVSNIAEGHERGSRTEYVQFCYYAKGSAGELRAQVLVAHDCGLIDAPCFDWLHERCERVSAQLSTYVKHLQESAAEIRGAKFTRSAHRDRKSWEEWLEEWDVKVMPNGQCVVGEKSKLRELSGECGEVDSTRTETGENVGK
jgi:four helix bundle protein